MGMNALDFDDDDEDRTPFACRACGGQYRHACDSATSGRHSTVSCRWCTDGIQSPAQFGKWHAHKSGTREKVKG